MKTRRKGNRNRLKLIKVLSELGYLVAVVENTTRYSSKDAFGLFDIAFIKDEKTYWVQVTTNTAHKHKIYKSFATLYKIPTIQVVFIDYKDPIVYVYYPVFKTIKTDKKNTLYDVFKTI